MMTNKVNEMTIMLENFYKSCKYSKFQSKCLNLYESSISSDVKNYLRILSTNFLFLVNKNKAIQEYDKINLPTENKYLQAYYFLEIICLINKEEFSEAEDKLYKYRRHGSITKEDADSLNLYLSVYSKKEIKDIEKIFSINNRILYQNVFNARLLMDYYDNFDDGKALEYAKFIKKQKTDFTDTNNKADLVISKYKK